MKNQHLKNIAQLHIAMLFISTSGVLDRYISMSPPVTIFIRGIIALIIIGAFCKYQKISFKILNKRDAKTIFLSGIFLAGHWVTYFYSLQLSNVAIAMLSLFTYPVITTFLEPLFFKSKLNFSHLLLGMLVLLGIYLLTPEVNLENNYTKGILLGLLSALFYALRNVLLKSKVTTYDGSMLMFYQLVALSIILLPTLFFFEIAPTGNEMIAILTLALLTTAIGHTLFVKSFKNFSISSVSIMSSIQPIYGIILAVLFLNELPTFTTVLGGVLILSTVLIESIVSARNN